MVFLDDRTEIDNWMGQSCPEFTGVPPEVQLAAYYFMILWSVFDKRNLNRSASRLLIAKYCEGVPEDVEFEPFETCWNYYQGRFADPTGVNDHFNELVGEDYGTRKRLEPTIAAQQGTPKDKLTALVWITYRLRCNLMHGAKHKKGISDQYDNLMMGAKLMTKIMDLKLKPVG
ncbi:hypothetical protein JQV27_20495 [Sulfitobacter mediterraneus]|uniref:hypothetical protein n=1 Tax=Sulfitobacter mediterraneus TaxID=83219 RepID=UPI0019335B92|nr:hypothetical protein [Sulfitobacter mediterraneus]MBM1635210.1 hypothetical protein [Sulfitobacter mediterraneus]MBM1643061.1 hypothetical protein [Sulfitobacter mediterraneus]MBM1647108.1 hypothetical protein [Sulfitobacter mediterraneus]MBM1651151.1 hypothetical protein [Sulfitobacter mediterraneus]MBM1655198.1 hypothetical protein [Sulfitobacter mediterraneus]